MASEREATGCFYAVVMVLIIILGAWANYSWHKKVAKDAYLEAMQEHERKSAK